MSKRTIEASLKAEIPDHLLPPEGSRSKNFAGYWQTSSTPALSAALLRWRSLFDENPVNGFKQMLPERLDLTRKRLASWLRADYAHIGFCTSTTQGIFTAIGSLRLPRGSQIVYSTGDHYAVHASVQNLANLSKLKTMALAFPRDCRDESPESILDRYKRAISQNTRLVCCTWVNSSNGFLFPVRQLAEHLRAVNSSRDESDQVYLLVDGAHALGQIEIDLMGYERTLFIFPFHKWMMGPRGTACIIATRDCDFLQGVIPDFSNSSIGRFMDSSKFTGTPLHPTVGELLSPGGFNAYESFCALPETLDNFCALEKLGVRDRLVGLANEASKGLTALEEAGAITMLRSRDPRGHSSIVAFDCHTASNDDVSVRLGERGFTVLTSPYRSPALRVGLSYWHKKTDVEELISTIGSVLSADNPVQL